MKTLIFIALTFMVSSSFAAPTLPKNSYQIISQDPIESCPKSFSSDYRLNDTKMIETLYSRRGNIESVKTLFSTGTGDTYFEIKFKNLGDKDSYPELKLRVSLVFYPAGTFVPSNGSVLDQNAFVDTVILKETIVGNGADSAELGDSWLCESARYSVNY